MAKTSKPKTPKKKTWSIYFVKGTHQLVDRWFTWNIQHSGKKIEDEYDVYPAEYEFSAVMYIKSYYHYSSAGFRVEDINTGFSYEMGMKDVLNLIQNHIVNKGVVAGNWGFRKVGSCYRLEYRGVTPPPEEKKE